MNLAPKEIKCECGHTLTIDRESDWCTKCCSRVFYDPKDKKRDKIKTYYFYMLAIITIVFVSYLFIEMVAVPTLEIIRSGA